MPNNRVNRSAARGFLKVLSVTRRASSVVLDLNRGTKMGTDYIQLFNKGLADQILAMDRDSLTKFLEEKLSSYKNKRSIGYNPVFSDLGYNGGSVSDAVERLLSSEYNLPQLRESIAVDFAFRDSAFDNEQISVDYWGCWAEIFGTCPEGSVSGFEYSANHPPEQNEEGFVLLKPEHLDQMIKSLYEHFDELKIMREVEVKRVVELRDICNANPDYWVAYWFDI